MDKEKIKILLQPMADVIVKLIESAPKDEWALSMIFFGLYINDYLTDRGIYLD